MLRQVGAADPRLERYLAVSEARIRSNLTRSQMVGAAA